MSRSFLSRSCAFVNLRTVIDESEKPAEPGATAQRPQLSRVVLAHAPRQLGSWLTWDVGQIMKRYLFVFGYESPADAEANRVGSDFETSNAVWVGASSEKEAIQKGRSFVDAFVAKQYLEKKIQQPTRWSEQNFAHWISRDPIQEFSGLALESFPEI